MKPSLSKEIAYKALQGFFKRKPFVLFGTGTSCAVDLSFGMPALHKRGMWSGLDFISLSQESRPDPKAAKARKIHSESLIQSVLLEAFADKQIV